eukprot:Rmarinus@m.10727
MALSIADTIWDVLVFFREKYTEDPDLWYHGFVHLFLAITVIVLWTQKSYSPNKVKADTLSEKEIQELCDEWEPEPLVSEEDGKDDEARFKLDVPTVGSASDAHIIVEGKKLINMASRNFLGLASNPGAKDVAKKILKSYGCGSCGPRGFYGSIDQHEFCEQSLAKFYNTEHGILYSFGAATISSTIPAFCKRGDLIVCDEHVNFCIQTGATLSRSKVLYFKHNDMADLERILKSVCDEDVRKKRKPNLRFVVVETIYNNTGELCPLDEVVRLKNKYKFRLIADESLSLGVLGTTGHGALEHFGLSLSDVEIVTANLGYAVGSVGGICVSKNHAMIDHQRLSGIGYCFSASLPPFQSAVTVHNVGVLADEGSALVAPLQDNIKALKTGLDKIPELVTSGSVYSPLLHLRFKKSLGSDEADESRLRELVAKARKEGVFLSLMMYAPGEHITPRPSVAVTTMTSHTKSDLTKAISAIGKVAKGLRD